MNKTLVEGLAFLSLLATTAIPVNMMSMPTIKLGSAISPVTNLETVSPTTGTASMALEILVADSLLLTATTAQ
jgi:hypothetical protein